MIKSNNGDVAISLKNIERGYGNTKVIDNLNLTIKTGSINALIGASGSGKTTILRTILGRLIPDSGEVTVFGKSPNDVKRINSPFGFCPQEVALYYDITMEHTLQFFSNIHGIPDDVFQQRRKEIIDLLDLHDVLGKSTGLTSGGQKKRISLAVALLHCPKILILDEPTVGIDTEISANIWKHLTELASSGVTIIITTHYINEAKNSDIVFLLRDGYILENGQPTHLTEKYNCESLEDVFLLLCKRDSKMHLQIASSPTTQPPPQIIIDSNSKNINNNNQDGRKEYSSNGNGNDGDEDIIESTNEKDPLISISKHSNNTCPYNNNNNESTTPSFWYVILKIILHAWAIGKRKFKQIYRNKVVLAFELLSPTVQIVLYFLAIGGTPKNLNFGVVNADVGMVGGMFINNLSQSGIFNFHNYSSTQDAIEQIKNGNSYGMLDISENFTSAIFEKFTNPTLFNPDSQVNLYMDFTNYQITLLVEQQLQLSFESLASSYNITLNPVNIELPAVYGDPDAKFIYFLAPGMIGLICFAHAISITSVSFVREKVDGSLDRLFCYGVRTSSIVFGHFIGHLPLLLIQISVLLLIAIYGFGIPIKGDIVLVFLMTITLSFVGMSLGLVISAVSRVETEAIQLSLGVYFPTLICSGTLWPIQSIPQYFQFFPQLLPATWAASALRDIFLKGVGLNYFEVWKAFLIVIAWLIGLTFIAIMALNEKDKNFKLSFTSKKNK